MSKFSILRDIIALPDISAQQKLVLIALNQFGDEGRNVYPSLHTIAKSCALGYRQVRRHVSVLRERGYLVPQGKSKLNTTRYTMVVPHVAEVVRVPSIGTQATPSRGHERPPTTLNHKPLNPISPLTSPADSYFDSRSRQPPDSFWTETVSEQVARLAQARLERK